MHPIIESIKYNNITKLGQLAEKYSIIEEYEDEDEIFFISPLSKAVQEGNPKLVKYLVEECSADPVEDADKLEEVPLARGSRVSKEIVQYLVESCSVPVDIQENSPLVNACSSGKIKIVKFLVREGADPREGEDRSLIEACKYGNFEIAKFLIEKCQCDPQTQGDEPIIRASWSDNPKLVKYLVEEQNCDPHVRNEEPLCLAAASECLETVKYLVEECSSKITIRNSTPLLNAVRIGSSEVVNYLISRGAEITPEIIQEGKRRPEIRETLEI